MSRNQVFWILNTLGWGMLFLSNMLVRAVVLPKYNWATEFLDTGTLFVVGMLLTIFLRRIVHRLHIIEQKAWLIIVWSVGLIILASAIHTSLILLMISQLHSWLSLDAFGVTISHFVQNMLVISFIYAIWIAAYFGSKYFSRVQQLKLEQLHLEKALNEAQLNSLVGQLNPHYMFNALNNIRALMLEDVDRARAMLSSLSASLRYSLNSHKQQKVSLEEELKVVGHFIELSRIQLEDRLNYQEEMDPRLSHYLLPPMLIQLLVENAIKHGISRLIEGGLLLLKIGKEKDCLFIEVLNDYDPNYISPNETTQIGLKNIQERLDLIYDSKASFSYKKGAKQVVVSIRLPLEEV